MTCPVVESIFNVWSLTDFFIEVLFTVSLLKKHAFQDKPHFSTWFFSQPKPPSFSTTNRKKKWCLPLVFLLPLRSVFWKWKVILLQQKLDPVVFLPLPLTPTAWYTWPEVRNPSPLAWVILCSSRKPCRPSFRFSGPEAMQSEQSEAGLHLPLHP